MYNTDPKNEEIFNQDFSKITDKHALIMYSKRKVVIAFADITVKHSNKSVIILN